MTDLNDDELAFLKAIAAKPQDDGAETRLVYADWLEERGDSERADFIRLHMALSPLSPDDARRVGAEHELSLLRKGIDRGWLDVIEPERAYLTGGDRGGHGCKACEDEPDEADEADDADEHSRVATRELHRDAQDTECDAWRRLLQLVEDAYADKRTTFEPLRGLRPGDIPHIVTLPRSIAKLTSVTRLVLYGSDLVRIPPEIGGMRNLASFDPYTSYKLHWFPYEITRCTNLRSSTVSTRALYGNFKHRTPFPRLSPLQPRAASRTCPSPLEYSMTRSCSVCGAVFEDLQRFRVWISLRVATDVLPLLVNACSDECIAKLPRGADNHVATWHRGGPDVVQPKSDW